MEAQCRRLEGLIREAVDDEYKSECGRGSDFPPLSEWGSIQVKQWRSPGGPAPVPPAASPAQFTTLMSPAALKCAGRHNISAQDLSDRVVVRLRPKLDAKAGETVAAKQGFLNFRVPATSVAGDGEIGFVPGGKRRGKSVTPSSMKAEPTSSENRPNNMPSEFVFRPIGVFRSCFKEKYGTPRQGAAATSTRGWLELHTHVPAGSVEGLDKFSHAWLIFVFHKNTNKTVAGKVRAPRLGGRSAGALATRAPHRPNPIGQTLAVVEKVDLKRRMVYFSGIDLIEGTPVLDIKPLHPAEIPPPADLRFPDWIQRPQRVMDVRFSAAADEQLRACVAAPGALVHFQQADDVRRAVMETLALDPRTLHSKRKHAVGGLFGIMIDGLDVAFRVDAPHVEVVKVSLSQASDGNDRTGTGAKSATNHRTTGLRTRPWLENLRKELKAQLDQSPAREEGSCGDATTGAEASRRESKQSNVQRGPNCS